MPLPRAVGRFNRVVTNRFMEPLAGRLPMFAVVHHCGRNSGTWYRTPVNCFRYGDEVVLALTYGADADWVRNVLAGPASLEFGGTNHPIREAKLVDRAEASPALPLIARQMLKTLRVHHFLLVSVSDPETSQ